jgi:hypothetical protein
MSQQNMSQQAGSQRAATVEHSALGQVTIFTAILALGLMWTLAAAGVLGHARSGAMGGIAGDLGHRPARSVPSWAGRAG